MFFMSRINNKKKIAVIFGGKSTEHEVSRLSAQSVIANLNKDKYDIKMIGITKQGKWLNYQGPLEKIGSGGWEEIAEKKQLQSQNDFGGKQIDIFSCVDEQGEGKIDVVFPVLHGLNGEDGTIQGFLELADIPYVGCGVLSSAVAMDKAFAKVMFEKAGIPTGKYLDFTKSEYNAQSDSIIEQIEKKLGYPCFIKPCNSGSSVGVNKARNKKELIDAIDIAKKYDRRILVEEFINGREIECSVLGNNNPEASNVGEVIPDSEFYDYRSKYSNESTSKTVIPADLPCQTIEKIKEYAVKAFKSLDCAGLARVDFFVDKKNNQIYINEINTLPGFTKISMYPKLWQATNMPYEELLEKLIDLAIERFYEKNNE